MYYNFQKLEGAWQHCKPQWYKITSGKSGGGAQFFTSNNVELGGDADTTSKILWQNFTEIVGALLVDGIYTVRLAKNDKDKGSSFPFKVVESEIAEADAAVGNTGAAANTPLSMGGGGGGMNMQMMFNFMQMMNQMQADNREVIDKLVEKNQAEKEKVWQKEFEMFKFINAKEKGTIDKIIGILGNPHLGNNIGLIAKASGLQTMGIARATPDAPVVPVQRTMEIETAETPQQLTPEQQAQMDAGKRIHAILQQVQQSYPGQDPIAMLEMGVEYQIAKLLEQNQAAQDETTA